MLKWENGESYPEIDRLINISNLFKVSIDSVVKESDKCSQEIVKNNVEMNDAILFLCKAKKLTYASSGNKNKSSRLNSHDLQYEENNFKYIDSYLGSEKFIGEEAIWSNEKPYWGMNYYGQVLSDKFSGSFLKEVLLNVEEKMPYRGPSVYQKGDYKYHCMIEGDFECFSGKEEIYFKQEKVYKCIFQGGIIL